VTLFSLRLLDQQADGDTLLNIEHIFIFATVGRAFLLVAVAVQVYKVNLIEGSHQTATHTPECWIVQIAIVGNEGNDALTALFDTPLR
jgi:hypothetical protein